MPFLNEPTEPAESHGAPRQGKPKSLWQVLQEGVDENPHGLALACLHRPHDYLFPSDKPGANLEWTHSQLSRHAETLAARIYHAIPGAGVHTVGACFVPNGAEWALLSWAAARLQMPIAVIDPNVLLLHSSEDSTHEHYLRTVKPQLVLVTDHEAASVVDRACVAIGHSPAVKLVVSSASTQDSHTNGSWTSLQDFLRADETAGTLTHLPSEDAEAFDPQAPARIVFTGGSTGLAKACAHSHLNLWAQTADYAELRGLSPQSRTLVQSPVHHVLGNIACLLTWRAGGAVVLPFEGNQYDAGHSIWTIREYKVSYLPVHPSMTEGILQHPTFSSEAMRSLRYIQLAGAPLGPELIERYLDRFGACADGLKIGPNYAMTEAYFVIASGMATEPVFSTTKDDHKPRVLSVGRVWTGARVKVADPETNATLPRGHGDESVGEIHVGGDTVIAEYLGGAEPESFYTDAQGHRWLKSGDQGRMAPDGSFFCLGRYKDLIRRGGENVYTAPIEHKLLTASKIKTAIVSIPDAITGEACVAVVDPKGSENFSRLRLQTETSKHFGAAMVFARILTLDDLGLDEFPHSPSNKWKIRKAPLQDTVLKHLQAEQVRKEEGNTTKGNDEENRTHGKTNGALESNVTLVQSVWARHLNVEPAEVDPDTSLQQFMDSLTAMRYCFEIETLTSKRLSPRDLHNAPTIRDQAALISQAQSGGPAASTDTSTDPFLDFQGRTGPPTADDIVICHGDTARLAEIQEATRPILDRHGLSWESDVSDCFVGTYMWSNVIRTPSHRCWNMRYSWTVEGMEYANIRQALANTIATMPVVASVSVAFEKWLLYAQLRLSDKVLDRIVVSGPECNTVEQAVQLTLHDPSWKMTNVPEMNAYFTITPIPASKDQEAVHVVTMSLGHECYDGMAMNIFLAEMDTQLGSLRSSPHAGSNVDQPESTATAAALSSANKRRLYKPFADMNYLLQNSDAAHRSAAHLASKLKGVSTAAGAYWPAVRTLTWQGGEDLATEPYRGHSQQVVRVGKVPGILALQEQHGIAPSTTMKLALALTIMQFSGCDSAQFSSAYANRSWPFQEPWVQAQLPNPLLIGGPTDVVLCDWVRLDYDDEQESTTIVSVLKHMQKDEDERRNHLHAPLPLVLEHLPQQDAAYVRESGCFDGRMLFNYLSDMDRYSGSTFKALKQHGQAYYATGECGFLTGMFSSEREKCLAMPAYDPTQWRGDRSPEELTERFLVNLQAIVREESWHAPAVQIASISSDSVAAAHAQV